MIVPDENGEVQLRGRISEMFAVTSLTVDGKPLKSRMMDSFRRAGQYCMGPERPLDCHSRSIWKYAGHPVQLFRA